MWPAVHGDRLNVPRRIEIGGRKHARELIANITFKSLKSSGQEVGAAGSVLVLAIQTGTAGRSNKMEEAGFLRRAGKLVVTDGNGKIERKGGEIPAGAIDVVQPQFLKGLPIANLDVGIDKGNLHRIGKRLLLFIGHFGA